MPNRTLVWTLVTVTVLLVVVPLLSMVGMMMWGGGGMIHMGGTMMNMSAIGILWMFVAAAAVIALVVIALRSVSRA